MCQVWYNHPEGIEPPFRSNDIAENPYAGLKERGKMTFLDTKAGDMIITHDFLPHSANRNRKPFAKVITNPHVTLKHPLQLFRADGNYVCQLSLVGNPLLIRPVDLGRTGHSSPHGPGKHTRIPD